MSITTAAIAAAIPKCPLCLIAIAGTLGIELPIDPRWMLPITAILLAFSIALIARVAFARRRFSAIALAIAGATAIVAARAGLAPILLLQCGVIALVAASLRASWRSGSCFRSQAP